jgi:ribosome-binding factor A
VVSKLRSQRIADRLREELSEMLIQEVADPRVAGVTVTDVTIDRELAYADVYVSAVEGSERAPEILEGLQHAGGFLRKELSQRVDLRTFPRLRFHWDPTPERAEHMEQLFATLHSEPGPPPAAPAIDAEDDEEEAE